MRSDIAANVLSASSHEGPSVIAFNVDGAIDGGEIPFLPPSLLDPADNRGVVCSVAVDSQEEIAGLVFHSASIASNSAKFGGARLLLQRPILWWGACREHFAPVNSIA